jgi:hypothetical protein
MNAWAIVGSVLADVERAQYEPVGYRPTQVGHDLVEERPSSRAKHSAASIKALAKHRNA